MAWRIKRPTKLDSLDLTTVNLADIFFEVDNNGIGDPLKVSLSDLLTTGFGDMTTTIYDVLVDGVVDDSESLGGQTGSFYLARANHTGSQLASTVSDFEATVSANADVSANTTHRGVTTGNPHSVTASDVGTAPTGAPFVNNETVEVNGSGALITATKGTAYNKAFGSGAGTVTEGDDSRLSDARTPTAHNLGGAEHGADTLANLNLKVSDATLIDTGDSRLSDARTPTAHNLGGAEHSADTLANLNLKVSDATLIDTGDSRLSDARTPTAHSLGGAEHSADTLANLNLKVSDATLIDTGDSRLSDDRTASGIRTATTVVSASGATAPTTGQLLTATSTTNATWQDPEVQPYGEMYLTSSAETTIAVVSTPVRAAGTTTLGLNSDFSMPTDNRLRYNGTATKVFLITASVATTAAGNNKLMEAMLAVNGTVQTKTATQRFISTGADTGALPVIGLLSLSTSDYVELFLSNLTDNVNMTVVSMNLSAGVA